MRVGPVVDQIVTKMKVPKLIEAFSQRGQGQAGTQEQKALDELLVSRHGNLLQRTNRHRSDLVLDPVHRYPQPGIHRLVKCRHDQDDGVDGLHVVEEDQSGSSGVEPRRMVIVTQCGETWSHGEREHAQNFILFLGSRSPGAQRSAQRSRHLLRTAGQS